MALLSRLRPDNFTIALVIVVVLATFLPAKGEAVPVLGVVTKLAIALLFFLHGARLSREAVIAGMTHWRLHVLVLASTYVLFPLLGLAIQHGLAGLLPAALLSGILFLCLLPSTVQSSIAFTSIAGGNVAAAVCSASASNLLGVFLTPALVAALMHLSGGVSFSAVGSILLQLFLPFIVGHLLRPWIGGWVGRHRRLVGLVDRGSILLVVYSAFGEAVVNGLWHQLGALDLVVVALVCGALLAAVLAVTTYGSRWFGFSRPDEIAIVFCGSKKSLASGIPMASVLLPPAAVGVLVLPLMIFHQIQLMVCAVLARRYAEMTAPAPEIAEIGPAAPAK
ncbi:MAG TPA: bile acid:sodium symporter family protein [Hyphomicrobiales bacterium]|nr:bile acid:sodium symporter family protein [Hyphomicrobiales bacterium]